MWIWPGETANWHFLTIPKNISTELKETYKGMTKGFGSLPVKVTIGKTTWETSVFPDTKAGTYLLPIKAKVRSAEDLYVDERVDFSFSIRK